MKISPGPRWTWLDVLLTADDLAHKAHLARALGLCWLVDKAIGPPSPCGLYPGRDNCD